MELKETEKRLLEAVSHITENDGFTRIGVNHIANQAGCDKVLICHYLGGLDGLLVERVKRHDYCSFAYSEFIDTIKRTRDGNIKQIARDVLTCQLNYLKDNILMQELLVWELSGHSSFKDTIRGRERIGYKLQEELNSYLDRGGDNNMSTAIIISAINYTVLFARQYHKINGIDFSKLEAWEGMEAMIPRYVDFISDNNCL